MIKRAGPWAQPIVVDQVCQRIIFSYKKEVEKCLS